MSTENVDERLAQLERTKSRKDYKRSQIDTIKPMGALDPSSSTQIKNSFYEANDVARHPNR